MLVRSAAHRRAGECADEPNAGMIFERGLHQERAGRAENAGAEREQLVQAAGMRDQPQAEDDAVSLGGRVGEQCEGVAAAPPDRELRGDWREHGSTLSRHCRTEIVQVQLGRSRRRCDVPRDLSRACRQIEHRATRLASSELTCHGGAELKQASGAGAGLAIIEGAVPLRLTIEVGADLVGAFERIR